VTGFKVINGFLHTRFEKNPYGKGWVFKLKLGKGGGYRWLDFPGHSNSIHAPKWRRISITGRTLTIATNQKAIGWRGQKIAFKLSLRKNGNSTFCPAWWS
jgi:hypothetical protein